MRHVDFAPFYRSTVGFDHLFRLLDGAGAPDTETGGYPPYDIERTGDTSYRITMAVAGFTPDDIVIDVKETALSVKGDRKAADEAAKSSTDANGATAARPREYLHRGIAQRSFERRFQLADYVEVTGAELKDGLLHINLVRNLPERMKPRRIAVTSTQASRQLEAAAV